MIINTLKVSLVRRHPLRYGISRDAVGEEKGEEKMEENKAETKGGGLTVSKVKTAKPGKYHDGAGTLTHAKPFWPSWRGWAMMPPF